MQDGRKLWAGSLQQGNGDLCGWTTVTSYTVHLGPARPNSGEDVFAAELTTNGSADGTIQPGRLTWFYVVDQQPDGTWRVTGGESGP